MPVATNVFVYSSPKRHAYSSTSFAVSNRFAPAIRVGPGTFAMTASETAVGPPMTSVSVAPTDAMAAAVAGGSVAVAVSRIGMPVRPASAETESASGKLVPTASVTLPDGPMNSATRRDVS